MFTRHGAYDRVNIMNNGLKCSLNIFAQHFTPNYGSVFVFMYECMLVLYYCKLHRVCKHDKILQNEIYKRNFKIQHF